MANTKFWKANTKFWKVWLKPNLLTKDVDNDFIAEVSTSKQTLRNEDIAERIVTQFSNSTQLLKEPRTLEYEMPLIVS